MKDSVYLLSWSVQTKNRNNLFAKKENQVLSNADEKDLDLISQGAMHTAATI